MKLTKYRRKASVATVVILALGTILQVDVAHSAVIGKPEMATLSTYSQSAIILSTNARSGTRQPTSSLRALRTSSSGGYQITDESLANEPEPAMWSATDRNVTLSWAPLGGAAGYLISRDGVVLTQTTSTTWVDSTVNPGEVHNYVIATLFESSTASGGIWGFPVTVPASSTQTLRPAAKAYRAQAALVTSLTTATVQYQTFIPSTYVNAPAVGCSYGSGYKFGGDNRTFLASGFPYRTKIQAQAGFTGTGTVTLQAATIGKTTVYNSAGVLVDSATASASGLSATRLGASTGSVVDMRFSLAASNPFCPVGNSIQGAFTISVSKTGAWVISSGSHKQMPNHEIYVHSNVGGWVTAYTRTFADPICLVNLACPTASIVGNGTY